MIMVLCLPRSLDLSRCNFNLWGMLENKVHVNPYPANVENRVSF
jgi:hypothetical protein